jgi:hypothetical protein
MAAMVAQVSQAGQDLGVGDAPDDVAAGLVRVGYKDDLIRFLAEYGLAEEDVQSLVASRTPPGPGGLPGQPEYLVHESVLRSHGEFPCAGDRKALSFCRQISAKMAALFGIAPEEAAARVNRCWSQPGEDGHAPRVWIVGRDIVYHETAEFWARNIYYGHDSRWWLPDSAPTPLPPP